MYLVFSRGFLKLVMILPGSWRKLSTPTNSKTSRGNLQHPHVDKKARQTPLHALLWQHGLNCLFSTIISHMKTTVFHCLSLFPTSLCGVLVFGCALPPASCLQPPLLLTHSLLTYNLLTHTQLAHTHNLLTHNLLTRNLLTHNLRTHTHALTHTHNLLTPNLLTHNSHTHNLLTDNLLTRNSHTNTTCSHTHKQLAHIQLSHTNYTHTHNLLTHTQLTHTQL